MCTWCPERHQRQRAAASACSWMCGVPSNLSRRQGCPRTRPEPRGILCRAVPGLRHPWQLDGGSERAYFSFLQVVGTFAAAPAPASRPFQLKPKSAEVVPIEEFQGKKMAPGWTQPSSTTSLPHPPPLENNDTGQRTGAWLRKPSWSSWVKVKLSLSSLGPPSPRELGAGMSQTHSGQARGTQSSYQK